MSKKPKNGDTKWWTIPSVLLAVWLFWTITVIAHGLGANIFSDMPLDFEVSGQFGDSFGGLGALMASAAAGGAWYTVYLQRRQLDEQKSYIKSQEAEVAEQKLTLHRAQFETTFFNLMEHFANIVGQTDIKPSAASRFRSRDQNFGEIDINRGKDAFRVMASSLRRNIEEEDKEFALKPRDAWNVTYETYKDDLGHYFRTLYNIVRFVDAAPIPDKKTYTSFVRATLSNSELLLLAYNCAFGHGFMRFKPLVEKYALLNNLDEADGSFTLLALQEAFDPRAF